MKKIIVGIGIALIASVSQASYLFWQVDSDTAGQTGFGDVVSWLTHEGQNVETVAARVVAVDGEGKKTYGTTAGFVDEWYTGPKNSVDLSTLGDSGYSYYIEIVKASSPTTIYGYSSQVAYNDLPAGAITESLESIPSVSAQWHGGGTYKATPEPTSAMLMLLGVAGLALRRKQREA